ncbi:hypothetical protein [Bradyrhizobium sp. NP1]|uniref:hypothetical protein n=1 Tax=Bradyrhizobium sp. NP1 TaxID=3049772 RepID=UPI0025A5CEE2|nr:hypothetical protein [Bradyrhizobium sp. NP1]WJR75499.1 hypothetical protein QOU61_22150 [Bradyrhizobium sp. NP1]
MSGFFPAAPCRSRLLADRFALKKTGRSGAPLRFAPIGFIGVTLPITVTPRRGSAPAAAGEPVTFERLLIDAGVPDDKRARLLADAD